jgi:hypothetical protein
MNFGFMEIVTTDMTHGATIYQSLFLTTEYAPIAMRSEAKFVKDL